MNIQSISSNNFKGYDARPLKGFLMSGNPYGIAREMKNIGQKEGFKIYSLLNDIECAEGLMHIGYSTNKLWAQDMWTIVKNKLQAFSFNNSTKLIKDFFNLDTTHMQKNCFDPLQRDHISGGNLFIVNNGISEELLIGEDELLRKDVSELLETYGVNKVIPIPQMDFHIDLFIRPLDKKRILLADDKLALDALKEGKSKLEKYVATLPPEKQKVYRNIFKNFNREIKEFKKNIKLNKNPKSEDVEKVLERAGYEVIKVPGRIYNSADIDYEMFLSHICNYINANAFINEKGDLVYITNKSAIDDLLGLTPELSKKIGFSFEDSFIKSIEPYVKREHIYFVEGKEGFVKNFMLTVNQGGIHCATMEIPKDVEINEQNSKNR